ncbi:unnamed protein product, partial [Polarella glacialis]
MQLLASLREHGLWPDSLSLNSACAACGASQKWQQALSVLCRWRSERSDGAHMRPGLLAYNSVMEACKHPDVVLALLQDMAAGSLQPDITTLCIAASACSANGMLERQASLLAQINRDTR